MAESTPDPQVVRIKNNMSYSVSFGVSNSDPDTPENETSIPAGQWREFQRTAGDSYMVYVRQGNTWKQLDDPADAGTIFEYP